MKNTFPDGPSSPSNPASHAGAETGEGIEVVILVPGLTGVRLRSKARLT